MAPLLHWENVEVSCLCNNTMTTYMHLEAHQGGLVKRDATALPKFHHPNYLLYIATCIPVTIEHLQINVLSLIIGIK